MEAAVALPSQEYLNEELRYNPETGILWWRFPKRGRRMWRAAGRTNHAGYIVVCLDYQQYMAHRVIWKMHFGTDPNEIDHKDQDPCNNRLSNLRDVSKSVNMLNMKPRAFKHLPKGVSLDGNRFAARACIDGKHTFIGSYGSEFEAAQAYEEFVANHTEAFA